MHRLLGVALALGLVAVLGCHTNTCDPCNACDYCGASGHIYMTGGSNGVVTSAPVVSPPVPTAPAGESIKTLPAPEGAAKPLPPE
jgi:hypothetical protein